MFQTGYWYTNVYQVINMHFISGWRRSAAVITAIRSLASAHNPFRVSISLIRTVNMTGLCLADLFQWRGSCVLSGRRMTRSSPCRRVRAGVGWRWSGSVVRHQHTLSAVWPEVFPQLGSPASAASLTRRPESCWTAAWSCGFQVWWSVSNTE